MKYVKRFVGMVIIICCGLSAGILTLWEFAMFLAIISGHGPDGDFVTFGVLTLPILAYFWWAWRRDDTVFTLRELLYGKDS